MRGKRLAAVAFAFSALAVAACGGDDSDASETTTASTDTTVGGEDSSSTSPSPDSSAADSTDAETPASTGAPAEAIDPDATVRTISAGPPPASWDPATSTNTTQDVEYYLYVYDTLLRLNADNELEPHLATEWSYDDTRTVLTLTLRDDVTFTDGAAFNADVAKLNLDRVRTGTGAGSRLLAGITAIDVNSPTELVITQAAPSAKVLFALASTASAMASPLAIEDPASLTQKPVGSGPFVYESGDPTSATMVRNDDYWVEGVVYPARHIATGATDGNSRINAIMSDSVDFARISQTPPTPDVLDRVDSGDLQMVTIPAQPATIGINNTLPPFDNPKVIQAVNYALDRDTINEVTYNGLCAPTSQLFVEGEPGYVEGLEYEYDLDKAKELMAEAGVSEVTVKFQSVAGAPTAPIELIQSMLAEIGITLEVTPSPIADVFPNFFSGQYAMSVLNLFLSMPDSSFKTDYITGPLNPGTKDPALVALVNEANALDPADPGRDAAYEAVNRYLFDNPIMVSQCQIPNTMLAKSNVVGIDDIPFADIGGIDLSRVGIKAE